MKTLSFITLGFLFLLFSCKSGVSDAEKDQQDGVKDKPKGELFIIGGGKRPPSLVKDLIQLSGVDKTGYIAILPMSSSEPDTSAWYARKQFVEQGIENVTAFNFQKDTIPPQPWIDSLKKARMIYVSGGDQRRFMAVVKGTKIEGAMHQAYKKGAVIAGTSAGAAIMSEKMITGDEFKHPEYTGEFRTIEANNIEIVDGMGFTDKMIVDQHFVWRMRMNRLMSVAIEHPDELAIGIDESTAIHVTHEAFKVYGKSQVIVINNVENSKKVQNGLLGARDMRLHVLLPGDQYKF